MRVIAFVRDAAWLHRDRARAYAFMLALGMGIALSYDWFSTVLGHHPGVPPTVPGEPGPTDFLSFWCAGRLALGGDPASAWNLRALAPLEHATAALDRDANLAFFYPPPFLLLCLPFAALPYLAGFAAFVAAQGAALIVLLRRILPRDWGWLPVLGFPGLLMNAATGQNGFISAACLAASVLWLDRRPLLAGAALGGLVFKPHLALCVPVALLAARRWRAAFAAGGTAMALLMLSWLVLGTASYAAFLQSLPAVRGALEHHPEDWGKLQSLYTAARLCGASLGVAYGLQAGLAVLVAAALAWLCWQRPGGAAEMAALSAAALLCAPHVLDYDLAVTGVPLAWLARGDWRPWEKSVAAMAFVWPLLARISTQAHVAVGPFVLLALFVVVWRRVEGRSSFLKKRSKKLLPVGFRGPTRSGPRVPASKSFLVLFFKKEHALFSLS
jgi:hypothetical protein